jgi:hypothetical protein
VTRKSKRELERALEYLRGDAGVDYDGPTEIVLRDQRVGTGWSSDDGTNDLSEGERELEEVQRLWRDETGEWHSEIDEDPDTGD